MPKFDFSNEIINIFNTLLGIDTNEKLEAFIKNNINIQSYTYHQIIIFIKLFINQFSFFKSKIIFYQNGNDITKSIIEEFILSTKYFTNGSFPKLIRDLPKNNENEYDYINLLEEAYSKDLEKANISYPLFFINKEERALDKIYFQESNFRTYKNSYDYLKRFKDILGLPNDVEKDIGELKSLLSILKGNDINYVITNDNFKKMLLIVYRIKANIPVIIMGETGCGKTSLILKLNQLLNNGKTTLHEINIHPGIKDEDICEFMDEKNKIAKEKKDQEFWIFFDEINTCLSFSLLKEIFVNRSYDGNILSDNIRLIGACNPYRKRKTENISEKYNSEIFDMNVEDDLVYLVRPLPQSLLHYVYSFGFISDIDEKKYIHSIIEKLFSEEEKDLYMNTTEAISKCHIFLRNICSPDLVSLREINKFVKLVKFFENYFVVKGGYLEKINDQKNNKLRSIICSIYFCYYIKLSDIKRNLFENELRETLLKLINNKKKTNKKNIKLIDAIENKELKDELKSNSEIIIHFSDFIKNEEDFLTNQIELNEGIGKNSLLKENIFLIFTSIYTHIPLIIVGNTCSSKSLSAHLIFNVMRGKYSNNLFFKQFPEVIQTYFQGSENTSDKDVEEVFRIAEEKYKQIEKVKELPTYLILFDELGLAEKSESNPIKCLHRELFKEKEDKVSFIGISNWKLDASKLNRAIIISTPNLDDNLDKLRETSNSIAESINPKIKDDKIFEILAKTYFSYKNFLKKIKEFTVLKQYFEYKKNHNFDEFSSSSSSSFNNDETDLTNYQKPDKPFANDIISFEFIKNEKKYIDLMKKEKKIRNDFHGNRDFYNLIKGVANELGQLENYKDSYAVQIINKYIERNFGGITYEIDINFNLKLDNIKNELISIKNIFEDYNLYEKDKIIKLNSSLLFKMLYNQQCENDNSVKLYRNLCIDKSEIYYYDFNNFIYDNINDNNGRFLLLEIDQSLTNHICQNIKNINAYKKIIYFERSPFIDDNKNQEFLFNIMNKILNYTKEDVLIIINNLPDIHQKLNDLYDKNFEIINDRKYCRINLDSINEQKIKVNDTFRLIVITSKAYVDKNKSAFLNKFEKLNVSFDNLLNDEMKKISMSIIEEINLNNIIKQYSKLSYSLENLLINSSNKDIEGLIYHYFNIYQKSEKEINEKEIKEYILNKIYKILPQDIITLLPDNNIIKEKYLSKNIYDLKGYLDAEEGRQYKISIIYTFTPIYYIVNGIELETCFKISDVKSENYLKNILDEIKLKHEHNLYKRYNYIYIQFQQSDSFKLNYVCNYLLENCKDDNYNYIILIYIHRNFKKEIIEKIHTIPDISQDINQIFIDNLNGDNDLTLKNFIINNISDNFMEYEKELNLNKEFERTLNKFICDELNEYDIFTKNKDKYLNEIFDYMEEKSIKEKIDEIMNRLIKEEEYLNYKDILEKIYAEGMINKYIIDISSCIVNFIKEEIYNKNLKKIFNHLENNNYFPTLIAIIKEHNRYLTKNQVKLITEEILNEMNINFNKNYVSSGKIKFNYNILGFYNFFENISNYIKNEISLEYLINEKKLRKFIIGCPTNIKKDMSEIEGYLINKVYDEVNYNHQLIIRIIDYVSIDLIIKDYITFYLEKYNHKKIIYKIDDINHSIIEILIKLRFNHENKIIGKNSLNILLTKIIWLESNVDYILNILKIIEKAKMIFSCSEKILYIMIKEIIFKGKVRYIIYDQKNPEHAKEVNECFYLLLASICYCITSNKILMVEHTTDNKRICNNKIQVEINYYYYLLKDIYSIMQTLVENLNLHLYEIFIIDELIKIIELFNQYKNKIKIITIAKYYLIENAYIIQKYSNNNDKAQLSDTLINNFENFYNLIANDRKLEKDSQYYDKLIYIFLKEIQKVSDINYRNFILNKLLKENEMVIKSGNIFQILFRNYLKLNSDNFQINKLMNKSDIILETFEENLRRPNIILENTLLYFFEKKCKIYLIKLLNEKNGIVNSDNKSFEILKYCIEYLDTFDKNTEYEDRKSKQLFKLFCIGYIKQFCIEFIKSFNNNSYKFGEPDKVIEIFNKDNSICKTIRMFIYKLMFKKYKINFFYKEENIDKYHLNKYIDYKDLVNAINSSISIDYEVKTIKNDYKEYSCQIMNKYEKEEFKNKVDTNDFNIKEWGIDNFYISSYNLILSHLSIEKYNNINNNFYLNICEPLFNDNELLLKAVKFFYESEKFNEIKKAYKIDSSNIEALSVGYRYCLNEIFSENKEGIYYPLYQNDNDNYIKNKYYPGSDSSDSNYWQLYSVISKHFKNKPEEGCYVCLCKKSYYHSLSSFYQDYCELNMKCPKCSEKIGSYKEGREIKMIKRDNYFRIYKDKEEIEKYQKDETMKNKIKEINYLTLEEFKMKYLDNLIKKEKGIIITDKNSFKDDNKIIRHLSQVSYRLLNYILYSHLFFAKLITENEEFDKYLPNGMDWAEILNDCWMLLNNELIRENINSIEEFMQKIFSELFPILNEQKNIDNYENLVGVEEKLELIIQKIIEKFKREENSEQKNYTNDKYKKYNIINLLKEKNTSNIQEYPYYQYFYYSDYIDENYLNEIMKYKDVNNYPLLFKYLDNKIKKNNDMENDKLLSNIIQFNSVLNLMNQNYCNKITRKEAEKISLKDTNIYKNNQKLFDNFIKLFNNLDIKGKISKENPISDYFIDDNNKYGNIFIKAYKNFIKHQNEELEIILNLKINQGILEPFFKEKVNVQCINENEIFDLNLPKKYSFIDIIYNYSYKKIIEEGEKLKNKLSNYLFINLDLIEKEMSNLLLKDKKLLNDEIIYFSYANEIFSNQIKNSITLFKKRFSIEDISLDDKLIIFEFYKGIENSIYSHKEIINNFLELMKSLNEQRKDIEDNKKIFEILEYRYGNSSVFRKLIEYNDKFTIDKTWAIFDYYLKLIYENVSRYLINYQEKLSDKTKEDINNYFHKEHLISKKDFAYSIRLFITLVVFLEEDKENKIKNNYNNIMNYLYEEDLWKKDIFNNDEFKENFNELKSFKVKINQIISLYEFLGKDFDDNYFEDVKESFDDRNEKEKENNLEENDDDDNYSENIGEYQERKFNIRKFADKNRINEFRKNSDCCSYSTDYS